MALKINPKELDEQYTLDKELISRNWFFVGAELRRIKREIPSTKLRGERIKSAGLECLRSDDRSYAIWMFENWRSVLDWIEAETGARPEDPFHSLSQLNASHPAHIKRRVKKWLSDESPSFGADS